MSITKEEVEHIANLARLGLSNDETAKMQNDLAVILDYVNQLKEADVSGLTEEAVSDSLENVWRGDDARPESQKDVEAMVEQFPKKDKEWLKVKEVL